MLAVTEKSPVPTPEEAFRSSLQDLIVVLEKMAPFCGTLEEAAGMANLALENDGQLRLLMKIVTGKQ